MKIAIAGKFGSGKNLFLDIARYQNKDLIIEEGKFAKHLYECAKDTQIGLGLIPHKDGKLLQFLGTHYRGIFGDNFWVDRFFKDHHSHHEIITDVRFPNELEAVQQKGYITIRIHRREEWRLFSRGNRDVNHISETALDDTPDSKFDYIINNNGSLELFEGAVTQIINEVRRKQP